MPSSSATETGLIGAGERGLLDRAGLLQVSTVYGAEKDLAALEANGRLRVAILLLDGLPPGSDGPIGQLASKALAGWSPGKETACLLVLIDKSTRQLAIAASADLNAAFPPEALARLGESVGADTLRVGDMDGTVAALMRGLANMAGKTAAANAARSGTGTAMKIERGKDGFVTVPALDRRVTDLTATLLDSEIAGLESMLETLEAQTRAQLAVLITPTTQPETIEQYSMRVVEAWKLGQDKVDNGVLLLVAKDDRAMRIEVGYGLEGALNDATAKRIISEAMGPRFREQDFVGGIRAGVERIAAVIRSEPVPATAPSPGEEFDMADTLALWIAILAGLLLSFFLRGRMAPTRSALISALAGAGLGLVLGLFMGGPLLALLAAIPVFLGAHLPLPDPREVRRGARFPSTSSHFPTPPFPSSWGGGSSRSSDGYSGGGYSGGGYSGGGGKFGGGGASGNW